MEFFENDNSDFFKSGAGAGKPRKKGGTHQKLPEAAPSPLPASNPGDESRKVHLRSGGTLRLELSIDLFDLDQRDRDFVFTLIDQLKEYEGGIFPDFFLPIAEDWCRWDLERESLSPERTCSTKKPSVFADF